MRRMIGRLFLLMLILSLLAGGATASDVAYTEGDFRYKVSDENTASVIEYIPQTGSGTVTIPAVLGGFPVTVIDRNAFYGKSGIQQVILPESIVTIGSNAFRGCSALAQINLPEGLTRIESQAFRSCTSLAGLILPSTLEEIGAMAFSSCSSLEEIVIPDLIDELKTGAFQLCTSLASVTLPDGISLLCTNSLTGCSALESIQLPKYVSLESNALPATCSIICFADSAVAETLEHFRDAHAPSWELSWVVPGELLHIDAYLGNASRPVIPTTLSSISVESIAPDALINAPLDTLQLPTGTQEIGEEAFCGITACAVVIPASVDTIGSRAFAENDMLYYVYLPARSIDMAGSAFDDCEHAVLVTNGENAEVRSYAEAHSLGYLALE